MTENIVIKDEELLLHSNIDYEADIYPHKLIQIYSGVGSGKNVLIQKFVEAGKRVLLITSRQITAEAQAKKLGASRWIDLDRLLDMEEWDYEEFYENVTKNVVCTNSGLAVFVKKHFSPDKPRTFLWNKFDYIVLDEAHSLSTDATYSDPPFYVEKFLNYAVNNSTSTCRFIFMTGTLAPIEWLIKEYNDQMHLADYFERTKHVVPKRIKVVSKHSARKMLAMSILNGHRAVYFANTVDSIARLIEYLKENGVVERDIGVMYSKDEGDSHFSPELIAKKTRIMESLKDKEVLPSDVKLFISTTKCKEGINIRDTDISVMYSENHYYIDLIQMAGRVRVGLDSLYIIKNAKQNHISFSIYDALINRECIDSLNVAYTKHMESYEGNDTNKEKDRFISHAENMFKCIRFNPISQRFEAYEGRIHGIMDFQKNIKLFSHYINNWDTPVNSYGQTGIELFRKWFPYSQTTFYFDDVITLDEIRETTIDFLQDKGYLDIPVTAEQQKEIRDFITYKYGRYGKKVAGVTIPPERLKFFFNRIGLNYKETGKSGRLLKIISIPEAPQAPADDEGIDVEI